MLVDAYLLKIHARDAVRVLVQGRRGEGEGRRDERDAVDSESVMRLVLDAGTTIFERVISLIDAVDLELYMPFVKHDAVRFYERSRLFFDVLSRATTTRSMLLLILQRRTGRMRRTRRPTTFWTGPRICLATAPPCPRFPLLSEHDLDDDDGDEEDEPPSDPRFFDPKRFLNRKEAQAERAPLHHRM